MLLALDTSNDYAGLAVWNEQGLRAEVSWFVGRQHTEQLLPQVDLLLRHLAVTDDLTVVAVALGPGSWSGLRAGISLAKAISIGRGLPIVGVPTLDALALGLRHVEQGLATVRLGRDRFAIGRYRQEAGRPRLVGEWTAVGIAEVADERGVVIGDLALALHNRLGGALVPAAETDHQRRAPFVAELAWERHRQNDHDDLVALEPIYLGAPVRSDDGSTASR